MSEEFRRPTQVGGDVRARVSELSVHLQCGEIRGPVPHDSAWAELRGRWQPCRDEKGAAGWEGCDVARVVELCVVCLRGAAGGPTRWSWLGCEFCRTVNETLRRAWGVRPLPLGRHSAMNAATIPATAAPEVVAEETARLVAVTRGWRDLREWRDLEYRRLAAGFRAQEDVPLAEWHHWYPPGAAASVDAFRRLLRRDDVAEALRHDR